MCLFLSTVFFGPRAAILLWWVVNPGRFSDAFDTFVWPLLGMLFLPWTTLMFVILWPLGTGFYGLDWLWMALAFLGDMSMYFSGYASRRRAY